MSAYSTAQLIACIEREIKMRERVYPRWVADKKMSERKAADEIAMMEATLALLLAKDEEERLL